MSITYKVDIPQLPALQKAFTKDPELTKQAITVAIIKSLMGCRGTAK